jgi:two-component system phosphate regulon sensor histidine kinase PhoR
MSDQRGYSVLALRTAIYGSAVLSVALFVLHYLWPVFPLWSVPLLALFCGLVHYYIAYKMVHKRLNLVQTVVRDISRKQFDDYEDVPAGEYDELDRLVRQTIRASSVVELEIRRLNKIENYRKEFIGDISHELKTPIFAVQGFIETLLNGALEDPKVNRLFLEKAMRNANRLVLLTRDLMEISKLETGELKSHPSPVLLHDVIEEVVEGLQYLAKKEQSPIQMQPVDDDLLVMADRNQLKQVLVNLVENAIKYNKDHNAVEIKVEPYLENPSKVVIMVVDHGIGIDAKDLQRVTERFYRVDKSRSRKKGGTGLGLAIVKHIIESHGEKMLIDSVPNEGSSFGFTMSIVQEGDGEEE